MKDSDMSKKQTLSFCKKVWSEMLPFVARSPEMKLAWLVAVVNKKSLENHDIMPYMRLFLTEYENNCDFHGEEIGKGEEFYANLFKKIDICAVERMIESTDIYDIPLFLKLIPKLSVDAAVLILSKTPPPYEKNPQLVAGRVFQAIYDHSSKVIEEAVDQIRKRGEAPKDFEKNYERFREILDDEKFLSILYPNAKI